MTDTGTCAICGSQVPAAMLAEHLAEHDTSLTAQDVRDAPVVDRTEDDPNRDLGGFVEGMLMGIVMLASADKRVLPSGLGWTLDLSDAPDGTHALYFVSPSGLRWRIRAVLEEVQS